MRAKAVEHTPDSFRKLLSDLYDETLMNLVQCGMDFDVTRDEEAGTKTVHIMKDKETPLREFMDLATNESFELHIQITVKEDDEKPNPQLDYNGLQVAKAISKKLLDAFFVLAEGARADEKRWGRMKELEPGAVEALECVFDKERRPDLENILRGLQAPSGIAEKLLSQLANPHLDMEEKILALLKPSGKMN
jgi:hypothetical protein